jgi:hypothetical protein
MPYTLLRVTDAGVVLLDYHMRRLKLEDDSLARKAFFRFARDPLPGIWAVWTDLACGIRTELRPASRLREGMPTRTVASPVLDQPGQFAKTSSPSIYDSVRQKDIATLLTSADGLEILEACCAAVIGWDGKSIVCVPHDRPRVWSTAEAAICDHLPVRKATISTASNALLLINAVKGTCAPAQGGAFPSQVRHTIEALFTSLTKRPKS